MVKNMKKTKSEDEIIDLETLPCPSGRRGDGGTFLTIASDTPEGHAALRYAARLAELNRGHLALLQMIVVDDFQHWHNVEDIMRKEMRQEAETFIWNIAKKVNDINGITPSLYVEEGEWKDALVELINENADIRMLVLGGGTGAGGPGALVSYFTGKGLSRLRVPVVIVPGNLDAQQIDAINEVTK